MSVDEKKASAPPTTPASATNKGCVVCKNVIPDEARYCNECKSYQDIRQYLNVSQTALALIVAALAFLGSSLKAVTDFWNRNSDTTIVFQGGTVDEITLVAMNTGRSQSLLRRYRLKSGDVLSEAELVLIADPKLPSNVVPANGALTIHLRTNGLATTLSAEELRNKVKTLEVTVEVEVQESDGDKRKISDTFPAFGIEPFIMKFVLLAKEEAGT